MPRRISSLSTLPTLLSGPVIIVIGLGFLVFRLIVGIDYGPFEPSTSFAFYIIFIGTVNWVFVWFLHLGRVRLDDNNLYVSNYRKEIKIPISEIADVTENRWFNGHPITIHLRNATGFGQKIVFIPTLKYFVFFTGHPIVGELLNAAHATKPDEFSYREFDL